MNVLTVKPQDVREADARMRYFEVLESSQNYIACISLIGMRYDEVFDTCSETLTSFAAEARRRGYQSCVLVPSIMCSGDKPSIEEAQYDLANNPVRWGQNGFYASPASEVWLDYLKELLQLVVKEYGFNYVTFDCPAYSVDIPGTNDRFYSVFTELNPGVKYPTERKESVEYLKIQEAKSKLIVELHSQLAACAKAAGARKVGIMPWSFLPRIDGSPEGTLNPACDAAVLGAIPDVDFLVVRMTPGDLQANKIKIGDEPNSPWMLSTETIAHAMMKDFSVSATPFEDGKVVGLEFYQKALVASAVSAPCGFIGPDYGTDPGKAQAESLADIVQFGGKLGAPTSPVAFVFSYSGTRHAHPYNYETVFQFYWNLAKKLALEAGIPMLVFHAETLEQELANHPEVQLLVFEEHFPMSSEQMMVIRDWWQSTERRAAVAFGAGKGFVADVNSPGFGPCAQSWPGILELIGLKQEEDLELTFDEPITLNDVSRIRRSAFLGENTQKVGRVANLRRVFGSRANVLYEVEMGDIKVPVVAEWRDRSTLAVFCGFGLSSETVDMAVSAVKYALKEVNAPVSVVDGCSEGVLWNLNKHDFLVISNCSEKAGSAVVRPGRANLWDCREGRLIEDAEPTIQLEPRSFKLYRIVGRRSKILDIKGICCLKNLVDGAGRAEIDILAGMKTTLVLRSSPREIQVDGRNSTITQELVNGTYYVTLQQCTPGDRKISLKW